MKCNVCKVEFALGYHSPQGGVCGNCIVDHPEEYIKASNKTWDAEGWARSDREYSLNVIKGFKDDGFGTERII